MRQNWLNKVPIPKKKELEKEVAMGTFQTVYRGDKVCVSKHAKIYLYI